MKLGISSYTYGWAVGVAGHPPACPLDENGLLDKAREHGVGLLQIGDNLPLHTFDMARLDQLAARAAQEGVELEVGARRLTVERVAGYVAITRRLGAKLLRFVIDDRDYHPRPSEVSALWPEIVPLLGEVTLGIENHDRFPVWTLRRIVEAAGVANVGVCLDTANSLGAGEGLAQVVATLAPVTVNLHIKDFHVERLSHLMGFTVTGRPAGQGMVELEWLLQELEPFNRCQSAILELWTPPEPALADTIAKESLWAAQSLHYLRPFFNPMPRP